MTCTTILNQLGHPRKACWRYPDLLKNSCEILVILSFISHLLMHVAFKCVNESEAEFLCSLNSSLVLVRPSAVGVGAEVGALN
jgi:hypothetical protein